MRVAIVGATGLVGNVMLEVLGKSDIEVDELLPVASAKSVGKKVTFEGNELAVIGMQEAIEARPDIALFSAGASTSREFAPKFAAVGCTVIDNSSAWRMDPEIPLIVPEVNGHLLTNEHRIIANPNCSTIQMVVALAPLHRHFGIKRLVISTYQSFTGTGVKAVNQYEAERDGNTYNANSAAYPYPIFENCIPHCDIFLDNDYTKEEMKLVYETRKILGDASLRITATAVRVPVHGGHSESVNVEFTNKAIASEVKELLNQTASVVVLDDTAKNIYPTPLMAKNRDEVFVGRIRQDESHENAINLWIVSDNLRKGAATNAIQIAEHLVNEQVSLV